MALTRDGILKSVKKPKVKLVDHPAVVEHFGEAVYVRVMNGPDSDSYDEGNYRMVGEKLLPNWTNRKARLLVRCICDEEGKRLLTDADAAAFGANHPGDVLDLLDTECATLNRLTKESREELRKNSNGQAAEPGSVSPATSA